MSFDSKWLEDFLILNETRNFSKAAQLRHITQPAFGRHIKALEAAVGQQLVDRSSQPIRFTPAGKQFRSLAQSLLKQLNQGLDQINGIDQPILDPLRIASPHSLSSPTLIELMDIAESPQSLTYSVDILRVDLAVKSLANGECDFLFAFDILSLLQPPYQNLFLGGGDFLLVTKADDVGLPMYQLGEESVPYLRYSSESYSARLISSAQMQQPTFNCHPVFESSVCQLHKEMALRGKGVAWLPDCLIKDELRSGKLVPITPAVYRIPYQVRLYRNRARLSVEAEQFWRTLQDKTNDGWGIVDAFYTA
ncbi:LysR family transcriptional regulator [Moritella sp. F3]|uniref:LysR family transcriptional regulator n=1 Tax=Moritella sp. F3 TaxID=2718882 RepID=UPI0018E0E2BD|nr:LysR family transcriptional regulator [Moritella sp. F3]GIC77001.1 LysR family transcriptional regulator [Moritella sp. F1]GIC80184.1 LysR family transcriptional regulator [Moritella sp. F3]